MGDLHKIMEMARNVQLRREIFNEPGMIVMDRFGDMRPRILPKRRKVAEEPVPVAIPEPVAETVPLGLQALKEAVTDYYKNPNKSLDMDSGVMESELFYESGVGYHPGMKFRFKSLEQMLGIEKLGRGHYSDVYAIDDKRALKIVKRGDTGYARFVHDVVRKDPSNPYLPKVYYSGEWGGKTVYILERLSSEPETGDGDEIFSEFKAALRLAKSASKFITIADDNLRRAGQMLLDNDLLSDLHSDNLMFRGDVPVITDPASD